MREYGKENVAVVRKNANTCGCMHDYDNTSKVCNKLLEIRKCLSDSPENDGD